jgi:hypothetical protein
MTKVGAVKRVYAVYQPTMQAILREQNAYEEPFFFENDYELAGFLNEEGFKKHFGNLREPGAVDWLPGKAPLGHFRVRFEVR